MPDLSAVAYQLCDEVREGAFAAEIERTPNRQPAASPEVVEALRSRCPGYTRQEYVAAIARGMSETR